MQLERTIETRGLISYNTIHYGLGNTLNSTPRLRF
jgi:hypothetical protein